MEVERPPDRSALSISFSPVRYGIELVTGRGEEHITSPPLLPFTIAERKMQSDESREFHCHSDDRSGMLDLQLELVPVRLKLMAQREQTRRV